MRAYLAKFARTSGSKHHGGRIVRHASLMPLLASLALACGGGDKPNARDAADANDTGRTLPARSASEQNILQQVAQLPAGSPRTFGDSVVVAEPAYNAASGRTCRALSITRGKQGQASHRLACTEGKAWFFVPDVLGLEATAE
jgi:hypothetical protein